MPDREPQPIRCAGCGARLGDRVGDRVEVRVHVRARQAYHLSAGDAVITCVCGRTWRSKDA